MQIILCVEYYNRVAENYLELASTQRLHLLFKLMERSRKRIEPMAKELGATKQEVHRNLVRLENSGLISKDKEGRYTLTTFGRASCLQISTTLFLSQHLDYFEKHDFGDIPHKYIMRSGQLAFGTHIKGITKTLEKWKNIYKNKYVKVIIVLNEKEACVCFPNLNGEADLTEMFYGDDYQFHEWCIDYFRDCWSDADLFIESKLKE